MSDDHTRLETELARIEQGIAAQEGLRGILPDEQVEATLVTLREKRDALQAALGGSGAIAQGPGAQAAGERGVTAETIGGPVVTGDRSAAACERGAAVVGDSNVTITGDVQGDVRVVNELPPQVLELFARQFGFDPAASDATALKTYFEHVVLERHSKLSFLFIRPETGKVYTEADVETVFVPLRLTDPQALQRQARTTRRMERFDRLPPDMEEAARPIALPEVLARYPCVLLRGKPGCGKTTLLRHIALAFARGEQREKLGWSGPAPLPLLVSLRNFGTFLKSKAGRYGEPQPRALLEYLEEHLRGAGVRFSPDFVRRRLDDGQCFLLLDALDEASGTLDGGGDLRAAVARQVSAFIRHYQPRGNRFALTSRPRAYQDEGVMRQALPQPQVCDVFDLDAEGYGRLIANLLAVLTGDAETGRAEAADLVDRIAANQQLADLAGNPLLCTTLVLVYKYRGRRLPERRVDVLHEIVTLLLGRWEEERRDVASPDELACLGTTSPTTEQAIQFRRRALVAVAWQMQQDSLAETPAEAAVACLAGYYCAEERTDRPAATHWARGFLEVAHERSGLFIAVDESMHAFAHQAFREYLAATHLVNAGEVRLIEEVLRHAPAPDEWWEQVLLLAGAHPELSSGAAGRLIERLLEGGGLDYGYLAARCARDMTDKLPGPVRKRLQDWLAVAMRDKGREAKDRALAGRALALAGDPRPGVGLGPDGLPDIVWCPVPAGPFVMGEGKGQHRNESLGREYLIGRYPVTQAQFAVFVQAGGYREKRYWTDAGWARREAEGWTRPGDYGAPFSLPNHPVVGTSWYEAMAFCRWLSEATGKRVTLPSEAEWEKAARGGFPSLAGGGGAGGEGRARKYPWGDEPDPNRANYVGTGIGTTSAVGCFPGGASPYGVEDLSGNVWEWCRTKWRADYTTPADESLEGEAGRVLRGGAFLGDQLDVRCACRGWVDPYSRDWSYGLRVVVVPV